MDRDQFWLNLVGQTTTSAPMFVTADFVRDYGPLPEWLPRSYDPMRDGYLVGIDTPADREARVQAIRDALAPYADD